MRTQLTIILVATALAVSPVVLADWNVRGQHEPQTSHDRNDGYMWLNPDTTSGVRGNDVYFSTFLVQNTGYSLHGVSDNENLATVQTEHPSWPGQVAALLGVWKDCNHDGYVGFGDNALFEYRTTLLEATFGDSICPINNPGPVPPGPASHNYPAVHNDGTWVDEFIALGPDTNSHTVQDFNPFDLNDNGALVWADWGKPGDAPELTKCNIGFIPDGTFDSTGGFLRTVDCFDDYSTTLTFDTVAGSNAATQPYSFSDSPYDPAASHSQLNQPNPWGSPAGSSDVVAFDCSKAPIVSHGGLPQITAIGVYPPIVPPRTSTSGSMGGTANETLTDVTTCSRTGNNGGVQDQVAEIPYSNEKAGVKDSSLAKVESDFLLAYNEGQRPEPVVGSEIGPRGSLDLGVRQESSDGLWLSIQRIAEDKNPYTNRPDLYSGRSSLPGGLSPANPIAPVEYVTGYAYVSPTAQLQYGLNVNPTGKVGTYGAEWCGTATSGVVNGWDCNAADWGCDAAYSCLGVSDGKQVPVVVGPGQAYNLRAVACFDSSTQVNEGGQQVGRDTTVAGATPTQTVGLGPGVSYGLLTGSYCQ
jgi:hypothetical protein